MPDSDIFFPSRHGCKFMSGIFQIYTTHILSESFGNERPGITWIMIDNQPAAAAMQLGCPAAAVTVHAFWVSRVFNIQR